VQDDDVARAIGRELQRMAERTRDEPAYVPHPIAVAVAEAVRAGNLTDGDGTFGAQEHHYQVHMSKQAGHFALLDVANLRTGQLLPPPVVLRLLRAHDVLADAPGAEVDAKLAAGVVAGLLGVDDASSELLLRKRGLGGARVDKLALLACLEALPA
jgi:hypothetical protein